MPPNQRPYSPPLGALRLRLISGSPPFHDSGESGDGQTGELGGTTGVAGSRRHLSTASSFSERRYLLRRNRCDRSRDNRLCAGSVGCNARRMGEHLIEKEPVR